MLFNVISSFAIEKVTTQSLIIFSMSIIFQFSVCSLLTLWSLVAAQDWEQQNFGIRNFHQKDDLIANVDEDAPRVVKTNRRHRFRRKKLKDEGNSPGSAPKRIDVSMRRMRGRSHNSVPRQSTIDSSVPTFSSLLAAKPSFAEFKDHNIVATKNNFQLNLVKNSLHSLKVSFYDIVNY